MRRVHSEHRVAILKGRSDLEAPWGDLALLPWRSISSVENRHRDRSQTFSRVRYDDSEVRRITPYKVVQRPDLVVDFFPVKERTICFPSRAEVY